MKPKIIITLFILMIPTFIFYSRMIFSEIPYMFFSLGAIYFLIRAVAFWSKRTTNSGGLWLTKVVTNDPNGQTCKSSKLDAKLNAVGSNPASPYLLAVSFALIAYSIKVVGITLLFAMLIYLLVARKWKWACIFSLLSGLMTWLMLPIFKHYLQAASEVSHYTSTAHYDLGGYVLRALNGLIEYFLVIFPSTIFVFPIGECIIYLGIFFTVIMIIGMAVAFLSARLRCASLEKKDVVTRQSRMVGWCRVGNPASHSLIFIYFILYILLIINWEPSPRYILPIMSFYIIYIYIGLSWLGNKIKGG